MSDEVFVIRNQLGQFWTRAGEWVDGREPQRLLKIKHHDEAVNQLVELSAKDIELRGEILSCELDARKEPTVEASSHLTPTLSDKAAEKKTAEAARVAAANEGEREEQAEGATEHTDDETLEPPVSAAV